MGATADYAIGQLNLAKAITYRRDKGHQMSNVILHCVFCNFRKDATAEQRTEVFAALEAFSQTIDGVLGFDFGENRDFENKSHDFAGGFVIRFANQHALEAYAVHPTHQKLGTQLCTLCEGGGDGIIVYDIEKSQ